MNTPSTLPTKIKRIAKSRWSWGTCLLVIVIGVYLVFRLKIAIDSIEYALTPPELPEYVHVASDDTQYVNPIGWPNEDSESFHTISQGTATIPIPYQWLVALEAPKSDPRLIVFAEEALFTHDYLLRHGFIKQPKTRQNPDGLPIGVAKTESIYFPGIDRKETAAGFTCAACHTGQILFDDKRYVIDGAPAMIDLSLLTKSLGAALGQTVVSSKIPFFDGRFRRFSEKVLGSNDNILTRKKLKYDLIRTIELLSKTSDTIHVTEGFTRLDALNRIGNQVFATDMARSSNYAPIDAPVNYPHIWTTSWFDWVQYDASIMQPLIRNSGEALGVEAYVDITGPSAQRFASSVDIKNLVKIEEWLGGTHPLKNNNQFNGLRAPEWPNALPSIDQTLATEGEALYKKRCQGCHLPAIKSEKFWSQKYWRKIRYVKNNEIAETDEAYLKLKVISVGEIGTDSKQAGVLANRTVDTTGLELDTDVCTVAKSTDGLDIRSSEQSATVNSISANERALRFVPLEDSATANFGLALGAFVERTNQQWFKQNYVPKSEQIVMQGSRPNCLQLGRGYKARPLNGVWATAPFLHNGSIATIYDLLSSYESRPKFVQLGNQKFDAKHVGIVQDARLQETLEKMKINSHELMPDYVDGLFILDTRQPGNQNTGHVFDDSPKSNPTPGKIGRGFSEPQKMAIIEYLKTL